MNKLVQKMLNGDVSSLARLITEVENDDTKVASLMKLIYPRKYSTYCIGITGPPGAGKSTIVDKLTTTIRQRGFTVGIIAVDPSSPFSGGALLGDRIRMEKHFSDKGVFIRSMATRGCHGGLPSITNAVTKLLTAFGKDFILIETVGVGQTELAIMQNVDTTVLILVPESGDSIQLMKAGIFEVADILVVNKADRPDANKLAAALRSVQHLKVGQGWWKVPVILTEAVNNIGIEELFKNIEKHRQELEKTGRLTQRRAEQRYQELMEIFNHRIVSKLQKYILKNGQTRKYIAMLEEGKIDPFSAADEMMSKDALLSSLLKHLSEERST